MKQHDRKTNIRTTLVQSAAYISHIKRIAALTQPEGPPVQDGIVDVVLARHALHHLLLRDARVGRVGQVVEGA